VTAARGAAALAALLALGGCSLLPLPHAPQPATSEGEWAEKRDAATRRAFLYDRFDHKATATATHLSLEVREARARRLAEWLGWTPAELEARLQQERREAAEGEELFLVFFTASALANDLDAPRSVWRVAVKVDGADVLPRRVTAMERKATDTGLFPYIGQFDVVYRVLLPPAPGGPLAGRPFVVEISSALGSLTLDYAAGGGPLGPVGPAPSPL
jgi:hypothetical protein